MYNDDMDGEAAPLTAEQKAEIQNYYRLPEKITTREAPAWAARRYSRCRDAISDWTSYELLGFFKRLRGRGPKSPVKANLIEETARFLEFKTKADFDAWFGQFSPGVRRLIAAVVFYGHLPGAAIELLFPGEEVLIQIKKRYYERDRFCFSNDYRTEFLVLYERCGRVFVTMDNLLRELLAPHLEPPFGGRLDECAAGEVSAWSGEGDIADSWPLFTEAFAALAKDGGPGSAAAGEADSRLVKGLPKKLSKELYAASGLTPFPAAPGGADTPDRADMAARFILCMSDLRPEKTADGPENIKRLVTRFFSKEPRSRNKWRQYDRHYFDFYALLDHLTHRCNMEYSSDSNLPQARKVFGDVLKEIAADGRAFDVNLLADRMRYSGRPFNIGSRESAFESFLKLRGKSITLGGLPLDNPSYASDYSLELCFRFELFVRPLFLAYFWLFAALGLVEITLREAPGRLVTTAGKSRPVSPYDSLATVKVTDLGKWCLGISASKPVIKKSNYEAIADRELLLVTVAGRSLEHRIFLDKVGERLGEQPGTKGDPGEGGRRWRISYASFLANCDNKTELEARISRFTRLIDGADSPHWQDFFARLRSRAGLFSGAGEEALLFPLPADRALAEELLADPALKTVAFRAEGRRLAVAAKNQKKFRAFLATHGILS